MTSSIPRPEGSGERSRRSASPKLRCARKQSRAGPSVKGLDTSTQIGGLRIMKRYLGRRSEQVAAASADTRSSLFNARGEPRARSAPKTRTRRRGETPVLPARARSSFEEMDPPSVPSRSPERSCRGRTARGVCQRSWPLAQGCLRGTGSARHGVTAFGVPCRTPGVEAVVLPEPYTTAADDAYRREAVEDVPDHLQRRNNMDISLIRQGPGSHTSTTQNSAQLVAASRQGAAALPSARAPFRHPPAGRQRGYSCLTAR